MKKLWFFLAMFVCVLASCSDGGSDDPSNPTPKPEEVKTEITIDSGIVTNGLSFDAEAGEKSLSFSVNANWTLSIASTTSGATWCKASATSGSKGSANVKFTVDENTSYDDRSVSITIKAGTVSKTFTITQKGADAMLVTTTKYEVAQEGGKIEVEVKANVDYQFAISETAKDWITETKSKSRGLTTYKHSFDIAENEEAEKREGEITFKSGDKVETVKVYQAGGAIILLTQNEYTVSDAGETISVDIKSNVEYGVQMPDVDWITDEATGRGMSSHTLKYFIAPNEGYDSRSAEIIFYDKNSDLKDTLKVIQAQKDAIIISKKEYDVKAEGEIIEVKLSANVDVEVQIPSDATWVTQTKSRALTEKNVFLKVAENTGEENRSAEIIFKDKNSDLSEKVTITQKCPTPAGYADGVVTIKTAGTIKSLLGNDYLKITSLKVVGPINGDDVYYLRKMLGATSFSVADRGKLTFLSLEQATIVRGGEYDDGYFTSDNVIGKYMFYGCTKLESIHLPKNATLIENKAFGYCERLKYIEIPDNVTSVGNEVFESCSELYGVKIGHSVTAIGANAFYNCKGLTSVKTSDLTSWFKIEFNNQYSNPLHFGGVLNGTPFKDITVPDGITSIKNYAFSNCSNIRSIIISDNVTSIGDQAFYGCDALVSVTIGNGVNSIGNHAFASCKALITITIPNNVISIADHAFYGCNALTSVVIGDGVTSIGAQCFHDCVSLKTVTVGSGVTSIGHNAFYNCKVLNKFHCYARTPPELPYQNGNQFGGIASNATLYVPERCGTKYKSSKWGDFFKNIVEMD